MNIREFFLGDFKVFGLSDGHFHLDGGAMFGVVPKTLWEKKAPADPKNRIKLALNSLLIRTKKATVLVETGIGTKPLEKYEDHYDVSQEPGLLPSLEKVGFRPEDIDFVVNTHLHFDHCGGNTSVQPKGTIVPAFPKAKYIIQKGEWDDALQPNERDKASYLAKNFLPLEEAGRVSFVEGDSQITEGVEVILTPGHTAFHQGVKIRSGGNTLFFLGDLVPTSAHIGLAYIMSYDLYPLVTLETKKKIYELALEEDWTLAFVHDPNYHFGKITKFGIKYEFQPLP